MSDRDSLHHESPSLLSGRLARVESVAGDGDGLSGGVQAYELKFHVPASLAVDVERWTTGAGLVVDPHGDASRGGVYDTTTLYLDTPELDVYHRRSGYARRKYRLRRYGSSEAVHLECKTKRGDRVSKERTGVRGEELTLLRAATPMESWGGFGFHSEVVSRRLQPACVVAYTRLAFVGSCPEGPMRVTIDRDARSVLRSEWSLDTLGPHEGTRILTGHAIVELKYLSAVPLPFKELLKKLTLNPGGVSKYRLSRAALGSVGEAGDSPCQNG